MGRLSLNTVLLAVVVSVFLGCVAPDAAYAAEKAVVQYRLTKQRTMHLDDEKTARSYDRSLKRLGCESKLGGHGGHFDLTYRCPKWRAAEFDGHDAAHQWQNWLKTSGFDTVFTQPAPSSRLQSVSFRLPAWKSAHFDELYQANSQSDTFRMLGCEVKQGSHAGHYDVSYRCLQWRTIGLPSDDDAHRWDKWLKTNGFETRHEHETARTTKTPSRQRY